ncbi:MAG TPA: DNA-formamidopyrimidine glycosylase family protein, partial [Acholeplasma sp.]
MPELPEVESIRRNLIAVVKDLTIEDVNVYYRPIVSNDITFETRLKGKTIKDIKRKGKYLFFMIDDLVM